jgi:hypothetical protein
VVVWSSDEQDGSYEGVFAQRFDSTGGPAGLEMAINTTTALEQEHPGVAVFDDGSFVVVWESYGTDGSDSGVFLRRFDSTGLAAGAEVQVNAFTTGPQQDAVVAAAADGQFVVVWESVGQDGDSAGVFARRFDADGLALGPEMHVSETTSNGQRDPAVAYLSDGSFVIVWEATGKQDGSRDGVFGRLYASDATPIGGEFQANTYTTESQNDPAVAATADGGFVVVWESELQDGDGEGVFGQRFDADAVRAGGEFAANAHIGGDQNGVSVTASGELGFVVVWESADQDGAGAGVFARGFTAGGAPLGDEVQVNAYVTGDQADPSVTSDADGDVIVVWSSERQDGNKEGMFGRPLRVEAAPAPHCGDPIDPSPASEVAAGAGFVNATDALGVMRAAVGMAVCEPCVCDVDSSGKIVVTDALLVLKRAVDDSTLLQCPPCD